MGKIFISNIHSIALKLNSNIVLVCQISDILHEIVHIYIYIEIHGSINLNMMNYTKNTYNVDIFNFVGANFCGFRKRLFTKIKPPRTINVSQYKEQEAY
jgi:hypothetical protein